MSTMLILRGIAGRYALNGETIYFPRGALDDASAVEYAARCGYVGVVLDMPGSPQSPAAEQVQESLRRIRAPDSKVAALYGFSGGGYNVRHIWNALTIAEKLRIQHIVVLGAPPVSRGDFPTCPDVIVRTDPPEGHMAGPRVLLAGLGRPDTARQPDDPDA